MSSNNSNEKTNNTAKSFIINYQSALNNYSNSIKYLVKYRQLIEDIEKVMVAYKEIIKDYQKKLSSLKINILKTFFVEEEKYNFKYDSSIYQSLSNCVKYIYNVIVIKLSSITNEYNELETKNIFKLINKKDDSYLNIFNQNKSNLQTEEKKMEKNINEYDNDYGKLMNVFRETEEALREYYVNKRTNEISMKNSKESKDKKLKNKNKEEVDKFNKTISNTLKYEEKFHDIHLSFINNNSKFFDTYDYYLQGVEKEITKTLNYLQNNFISYSSIILNNFNTSNKKIEDLNERMVNVKQTKKKEEKEENEKNEKEKEKEPEKDKEKEKGKESESPTNQDFELYKNKCFNKIERKYEKEKYKVKAIKETVLDDKLGKEKKTIINELNNEFGFEDMMEEGPLVLTEEDVYEITKTLYGPFQFVDKTEYDLAIEKKKIDFKNLTNKLLYFGISQKKLKEFTDLKPITDEEVTLLYNALKKKEYRITFLQRLNNYRSLGIFGMPEKEFNIFGKYFKLIADCIVEDENKDIQSTKFLLILSQTFYLNKDNNEKYYLQKEIKGHKLFSEENFWKDYVKHLIDEEIKKLENTKKSMKVAPKPISYNEIAFANILPFCDNMVDFGMNKEILIHIIQPIYEEYNMTQEMKETINGVISSKGEGESK